MHLGCDSPPPLLSARVEHRCWEAGVVGEKKRGGGGWPQQFRGARMRKELMGWGEEGEDRMLEEAMHTEVVIEGADVRRQRRQPRRLREHLGHKIMG
jgi:hypothetical protein